MSAAGDKLTKMRQEVGDRLHFRFDNGLVVQTEVFMKRDPQRILPLGGPQDTILHRLHNAPELARGKRVFEPFAGSGVFGLMALKLEAHHVDFLDINPRACEFQRDNARANGFAPERFAIHQGSIADYAAEAPYDLVLANPPFVPIPDGIEGTLTSAAGPEGNGALDLLLPKLGGLLAAGGQALIYVFQLVAGQAPLIAPALVQHLPGRDITFSPAQVEPIALADYAGAYFQSFPDHAEATAAWSDDLRARHGDDLGLMHYVVHVGPRRPGDSSWTIAADFVATYGQQPYPASANSQLALARVMENVVLP